MAIPGTLSLCCGGPGRPPQRAWQRWRQSAACGRCWRSPI